MLSLTSIELVDSIVYLARNKGMISFPYNLSDKNLLAPNFAIEKIIAKDDTFYNNDKLELDHQNKNLSIYFTAKGFRSKCLF